MDIGKRLAIEHALLSLFEAIDANDHLRVASLFTSDGRWHRRNHICIGRPAIVEEMGRRPIGRRIIHLVSNLIVTDVNDAAADLRFKTLAFSDDTPVTDQPSPLSTPITLDSYEAHLVVSDGVWLAASLSSKRLFARA